MTCERVKGLIAASWEAQPDGILETVEPDPDLKEHLAACEECRSEAAILGNIWQRLADLPTPEPSRALSVRWEATLGSLLAEQGAAPAARRTWWLAGLWPRNPAWQGAIALACLMLGLVVGAASQRRDKEIAKLHEEIAGTREMVALSLLQQETAAERLRGVEYSGLMKTMEPGIVSALIHAVNDDSSVNVRLAAIDALSGASGNPGALTALARSLAQQDSPMVQAALVDYFVDAHDRHAVDALRQLTQKPDLNPAVLEHTRAALRELSQ